MQRNQAPEQNTPHPAPKSHQEKADWRPRNRDQPAQPKPAQPARRENRRTKRAAPHPRPAGTPHHDQCSETATNANDPCAPGRAARSIRSQPSSSGKVTEPPLTNMYEEGIATLRPSLRTEGLRPVAAPRWLWVGAMVNRFGVSIRIACRPSPRQSLASLKRVHALSGSVQGSRSSAISSKPISSGAGCWLGDPGGPSRRSSSGQQRAVDITSAVIVPRDPCISRPGKAGR